MIFVGQFLRLTWLFASLCQRLTSDLIRQEVESIAGHVPQSESHASSEQTPGSLLPQDDSHAVDGPAVTVSVSLTLQTHLHQVDWCTNQHLKEDSLKGQTMKIIK